MSGAKVGGVVYVQARDFETYSRSRAVWAVEVFAVDGEIVTIFGGNRRVRLGKSCWLTAKLAIAAGRARIDREIDRLEARVQKLHGERAKVRLEAASPKGG